MIVSRNEIESLALKAARGAGMCWGLAEEASVAAGWLAERGLPWAETLVGVLGEAQATSPPRIEGHTLAPSHLGTRLCPIMTGALLSDLGLPATPLEVRDVLAPLWLAPFLARWAEPERGASLSWGEVRLLVAQSDTSGADSAPAAALAAVTASRVAIALAPIDRSRPLQPHPEPSGHAAPDDAWHRLQAYEHRSYVPASTQSRVAGAGAGLLDND